MEGKCRLPRSLSSRDGQHEEMASSNQRRPHSSYHPAPTGCEHSGTVAQEDTLLQMFQAQVMGGSFNSSSMSSQDTEVTAILERTRTETEIETQPPKSRRTERLFISLGKAATLIALAIVIAGLVSIPISLFALDRNEIPDTLTSPGGTTGGSAGGDQCIEQTYSGELCQSILLDRQSCLSARENSSDVFVVLSVSQQTAIEQELNLLLSFVSISEQCEDDLLALLCVEAFMGLCDPTGVVHSISKQECNRITTTTCAAEFEAISSILESRGFPTSCDTFPEDSDICSIRGTPTSVGSGSAEQAITPITPTGLEVTRNCSSGFFVNEESDLQLCTPECGAWWPQSPTKFRIFTIVTLTFGAIGFTLTLTVVLLSCINYKTVFQFPGIFIFYQMLSSLVYVGVFLLNYVDFSGLMCSSRDLVVSLSPGNETPLCILSAAAWIYVSSQVALWWIFHLSMIFCAVFWPFKYQYWRHFGYLKYIHITMVLAAIVLPLIPVIICLQLDGYVIYILFQPSCVARNSQAAFYSHVLPLILVVAIGLYLLILIFWKFFSEECKSSRKHRVLYKRQGEVKILLLLLSYIIIWTDAIGVTVATLMEAQEYRNTLEEYFTCEATGSEECPRGTFAQFDVISKLIASLLIALYPGIFLIYFTRLKCCCTQLQESRYGNSESVLSRK